MLVIEHKEDGRDYPVIVCDHCGERIERAVDGNYMWRGSDMDRTQFPILFTHKTCCHAFEKQRGDGWYAIHLAALPSMLLFNLGITAEESDEEASRVEW